MFSLGLLELLIVLSALVLMFGVPIILLAVVALAIRRRAPAAVPAAVPWAPVPAPGVAAPPPDPRAVLAQRLAASEITRDEYDTAMRALGLSDGPA